MTTQQPIAQAVPIDQPASKKRNIKIAADLCHGQLLS
jgi:hypothetical protein